VPRAARRGRECGTYRAGARGPAGSCGAVPRARKLMPGRRPATCYQGQAVSQRSRKIGGGPSTSCNVCRSKLRSWKRAAAYFATVTCRAYRALLDAGGPLDYPAKDWFVPIESESTDTL